MLSGNHEKTTADYSGAESYFLERLKNELSPDLFYHGYHHTLDVQDACRKIAIAENISADEKQLLRIAAAIHDAGFIYLYKDHEEKGCEMAKEALPSFGFNEEQINTICGMIMATKIPQTPHNKLEEIIADADLDYLGRTDVYPIAQTLFEELKLFANIHDEDTWNKIQINFLKGHHYFTDYSIEKRNPGKTQYLSELESHQ